MPDESDFTAPNEWCPEPQHWHAPDGNATETEVSLLVGALVRATQPDLVVETGSYHGDTTVQIGEALQANGHGWCETVEWNMELVDITRGRVAGLPVHVWHMDSADYHPSGPVGLAFLDSGTRRLAELDRLRPYLTPGALIVVHDTAPHHVDRPDYVSALAGGMPALNLRTPRGVAIFQARP